MTRVLAPLRAAALLFLLLAVSGAYANREYLKSVEFHSAVPVNLQDLLFDPQTSGGLLISLPAEHENAFLKLAHEAGVEVATAVGRVTGKGTGKIYVG